jgi:uncharacterized protein (DUF362 family)/Pyruvate/2-oxoacid:ferredoxin oxidoreductase delta subunit
LAAKVAAVKVGEDLARAVDQCVEHLGGWSGFVGRGESIVLKPNLVAPRRADTGATTNLGLLALLADRVRDCGGYPLILETPGLEYRLDEVWRFFDLPSLARAHGARLLFPDAHDWVSLKIPGGRVLKRAKVHRAAVEHRIFNLAKLKTHLITGATLAMKNLMGVCHDDTKRAMHIVGIHDAVVDLNRVLTPALNLIDGTVGMEGDGAVYGLPRSVGMLVASKSALATDVVGLELMGLGVEKVAHVALARAVFGTPEIDSKGDVFSRGGFLPPRVSKLYLFAYRMMYVIDFWFHRPGGMHFNEFLYRRNIVGTRPQIVKDRCDGCARCLEFCPIPQCLDLHHKRINMRECLRCLQCLDACPRQAFVTRGLSGNRREVRERALSE